MDDHYRINDLDDLELVTPEEVPGLPGFYYFPKDRRVALARDGRVYNLSSGMPRTLHWNPITTQMVLVLKEAGKKTAHYPLHRMLAWTFIGRPSRHLDKSRDDLAVNHVDGERSNNAIGNLEWVTQQENCMHAVESGLNIPRIPARAVYAHNPHTGDWKYFDRMSEAARVFELNQTTLGKHLVSGNTNVRQKDGYYFKYADDLSLWEIDTEVKHPQIGYLDTTYTRHGAVMVNDKTDGQGHICATLIEAIRLFDLPVRSTYREYKLKGCYENDRIRLSPLNQK